MEKIKINFLFLPKEVIHITSQIITGEQGVFSPKLLECFRKCRTLLEEFADKYSS